MDASILALTVAFSSALSVPATSWQVSHDAKIQLIAGEIGKKTKPHAVMLVHGLKLHVISPEKASKLEICDFQKPDSDLVKNLTKDFDVFAFCYGQTVPLDLVACSPGMRERVMALKKAGYETVTLIGHSAGGVIVREFVHRNPDAGVTKVIQVAAPNTGAVLANLGVGLPKTQIGFIKSMAPESRKEFTNLNPLVIPKDTQFACVVCQAGRFQGDILVDMRSQWPEDLQKLGVPAVHVDTNHFQAMKNESAVKIIGELARGKIATWTEAEVTQARKVLFDADKMKKGILPKVASALRERIVGPDK